MKYISYRPARAYVGYRLLFASLWSLHHGSEKARLQRQYLPYWVILFCSLFEGLISSFPRVGLMLGQGGRCFFFFSFFPLYCRGGHFWYITSGSSVVFVFPLEHAFRVALFPVEFFVFEFSAFIGLGQMTVFSPGYRLSLFFFFFLPYRANFSGRILS